MRRRAAAGAELGGKLALAGRAAVLEEALVGKAQLREQWAQREKEEREAHAAMRESLRERLLRAQDVERVLKVGLSFGLEKRLFHP